MAEHRDIEYDDTLVTMLEIIWGGWISISGRSEELCK